jgi:hypothetical protein
MDEAPRVRSSLLGRGIVCWPVRDEKGEKFIVKDYWMSQGRRPEYEILEKVKGKPGLCQIVSYEEAREETKDFRGSTDKFAVGVFHNAIAIRITMKVGAKASIDNFTSPEELLAALRDSIAGTSLMLFFAFFSAHSSTAHQTLVSKGFFHREISHNAVFIGPQGIQSAVGERGLLMHLDMAIGPVRTLSQFCQEAKSVSCAFSLKFSFSHDSFS